MAAPTDIERIAPTTNENPDPLAKEQLTRFRELEAKRKAERDDDWQIIAQYALPQDSNITTQKTESVSGWTDQIYDTTMIQAAEVLANGLFNWWTPPNQPWAEYQLPAELKRGAKDTNDDAVTWLAECGDRAMEELGRSNFYAVKATGDLGLAVFGTDLIIADQSDSGTEMLNFVHCKIGTYVIEENYKGIVDTVRRVVKMTWRQLEQKFSAPGDKLPDKMRAKARSGKNPEFEILHCIFPREDSKRLKGRKDGANKAWASVYISVEHQETIRVSGYDENPILCRRFKKWATVWGYGPSYLSLPDARQVNYVQQYLDALAELHCYPRVLIPDNMEGDVDLRAGGMSVFDTSNPTGKPEEWASVGDYKLGIEMQLQRRQAIKDAFYVDAFKLLNSQPLLDKKMTAFEISQRQAEQLQNITAVDARSTVEFIAPLMLRVFGIMFRAGKMANPPEALLQDIAPGKKALVAPQVVVTSRFNDAMKALKNRAAEATFQFIMPLAEQKPEVFDLLDLDDTIRGVALNNGMSPDNLRDLGTTTQQRPTVAQVRAARAKQMEQQRALQAAEQMGKAARGLGGAPEWMQEGARKAIDSGGG